MVRVYVPCSKFFLAMAAGKRAATAPAEEINNEDSSDETILRDVVCASEYRHHFLTANDLI